MQHHTRYVGIQIQKGWLYVRLSIPQLGWLRTFHT